MASLVYLFLAILVTASAFPESRIEGGTPTTIDEFPYIAAFTYNYPNAGITVQRCVGSLISSWHVLCSAFCFNRAVLDNMLVRAGSTNSLAGGSVVMVKNVVTHPDYAIEPRTADLAVVFLVEPLGISATINVLYLPPPNYHIPDDYSLKVVGWGFNAEGSQSETLLTVYLKNLNLEECKNIFADDNDIEISDNVICASAPGKGMCNGDSGAPMVIDNVIVGLSSVYKGCGDDANPDVFTRIDRFTNWILAVSVAGRGATGFRAAPVTL